MHAGWNEIERDWTLFRVKVKEQWGKLTERHLDAIAGNREQLIGNIRQVYSISQEQTEKQVTAWVNRVTAPRSTPHPVRGR